MRIDTIVVRDIPRILCDTSYVQGVKYFLGIKGETEQAISKEKYDFLREHLDGLRADARKEADADWARGAAYVRFNEWRVWTEKTKQVQFSNYRIEKRTKAYVVTYKRFVLFDASSGRVTSTEYQPIQCSLLLLSLSPEEVTVRVEPFAEKRLQGLLVEALSVPPNREVILIPPKIEVVVRGGIEQLAALTVGDFRATADYYSILSDTTGMVETEITSPSGVQIVNRKPERLQYIIRKRP